MEKLETEEGQGDWGKTESEEDRVYSDKQIEGEDEQDDNREDRYSLDHFTVDPASKSKDKIVIALSMKKFMFLQIKESQFLKPESIDLDKDKHSQYFYARYNLTRFIEKLFEHPRAIVVFITSKNKKNATEIFTNIQQHLDREFESDGEEYIKHLKGTFLYQENSAKDHTFEDGRQDKVRDIPKMIRSITQYYNLKGIELNLSEKNIICVETEKQKLVEYPDNLLYVPELDEKSIVKFKNNQSLEDSDEEKKDELDEENVDYGNNQDFNEYKDEEKYKLFKILELLYKALNEVDDVRQFLKENNLGKFQNTGEEGYIPTKTMFSYPDIDVEQLKKHPTISWLFEDVSA